MADKDRSTRFDWSPQASLLNVRMPTSIHDIFTEQLVEEIKSQLKRVPCENEGTTAILNKVWSESTSDVYLYGHGSIEGRFPKRSPDASLAHADSQYPSLVIETSYSKRQKNLAQLANDYICGSDGNIAVILGFDIEYDSGSKRATVSIWRPQIAPDLEEEGAFVLETLNVQEADVMSYLLPLYLESLCRNLY